MYNLCVFCSFYELLKEEQGTFADIQYLKNEGSIIDIPLLTSTQRDLTD